MHYESLQAYTLAMLVNTPFAYTPSTFSVFFTFCILIPVSIWAGPLGIFWLPREVYRLVGEYCLFLRITCKELKLFSGKLVSFLHHTSGKMIRIFLQIS